MHLPALADPAPPAFPPDPVTAARAFATALAETIHHRERFMARTREPVGWTARFREIVPDVDFRVRDLRDEQAYADALAPDSDRVSQPLGAALRATGAADGIVYPSRRHAGGLCVAAFHPDRFAHAVQGRHLAYHWNATRVDRYRDAGGPARQVTAGP